MLATIVRRWRERRAAHLEARRNGLPRGAGWNRLGGDPHYDFMQRMRESPGGQPPRVRWRTKG